MNITYRHMREREREKEREREREREREFSLYNYWNLYTHEFNRVFVFLSSWQCPCTTGVKTQCEPDWNMKSGILMHVRVDLSTCNISKLNPRMFYSNISEENIFVSYQQWNMWGVLAGGGGERGRGHFEEFLFYSPYKHYKHNHQTNTSVI